MVNRKIRIACCGDSITFGLAATSAQNSYPSVLQTLLGEDFEILNFGVSGATVISDYEPRLNRYLPYMVTPDYTEALNCEPDIVVLMLGMNDGNPTHHFNSDNEGIISESYLNLYKSTLESIIDTFLKLPVIPNMYLVKTTEMKRVAGDLFTQNYVDNFTDNLIKIRNIQETVAKEKKVCIIDTYNDMQNPEYYSDGCHLSDEGYKKIAEVVYKALKI